MSDTLVLWTMILIVVWTVVVSLSAVYVNRPKKCKISYAPRASLQHDEAAQVSPHNSTQVNVKLAKHHQRLIGQRIRPTAQYLRQAQQCVYEDIRQTCGPHMPKTNKCYSIRLQQWRHYIHRGIATGEFDANIAQLPLHVSEAHNIVMRKEHAYD